jgi:hypothetical protein
MNNESSEATLAIATKGKNVVSVIEELVTRLFENDVGIPSKSLVLLYGSYSPFFPLL